MSFSSSPRSTSSSGSGSSGEEAINGRRGRALYERRGPSATPIPNINTDYNSTNTERHNGNTSDGISFFGRRPLPARLTPGQILRPGVKVEDLSQDHQLMMGNILKLYRAGVDVARNSSQASAQASTDWSPNGNNEPQSPPFQFSNYTPSGEQTGQSFF